MLVTWLHIALLSNFDDKEWTQSESSKLRYKVRSYSFGNDKYKPTSGRLTNPSLEKRNYDNVSQLALLV
jgi:hypothetical protein